MFSNHVKFSRQGAQTSIRGRRQRVDGEVNVDMAVEQRKHGLRICGLLFRFNDVVSDECMLPGRFRTLE